MHIQARYNLIFGASALLLVSCFNTQKATNKGAVDGDPTPEELSKNSSDAKDSIEVCCVYSDSITVEELLDLPEGEVVNSNTALVVNLFIEDDTLLDRDTAFLNTIEMLALNQQQIEVALVNLKRRETSANRPLRYVKNYYWSSLPIECVKVRIDGPAHIIPPLSRYPDTNYVTRCLEVSHNGYLQGDPQSPNMKALKHFFWKR